MEEREDCLLFHEMDDLVDASLPRMYDVKLCRLPDKQLSDFVFTDEFTNDNPEFISISAHPTIIPWFDDANGKMLFLPYRKC